MFQLGCQTRICFQNEILSGLTVALALVPEAVAFAFVAGVEPLVGLYAAFMVGLLASIFGGRHTRDSSLRRKTEHLLQKLLHRRVPQIVGLYMAGSWGFVQFVDWAVNQYALSPDLVNFAVALLLLFLPTVAWLAWRHGAPGRLPQGFACDADGRAVRVADLYLCRYTRGLPGDRCGGAWAGGGDRGEHLGDVRAEGTGAGDRDRRYRGGLLHRHRGLGGGRLLRPRPRPGHRLGHGNDVGQAAADATHVIGPFFNPLNKLVHLHDAG